MKVLVTGGAGFIGSALVHRLLAEPSITSIVNLDALTYAANPETVRAFEAEPRHHLVRLDLRDAPALAELMVAEAPDAVVHLAAESHVDRSIDGPAAFIETNITGTHNLLEAARAHWQGLDDARRARFRFIHVSTDEVFGSLGPIGAFSLTSPYAPNSPYAASKAAADHLVRAWGHTYGLPVIVTNCTNNYGPRQFPEKLIPLVILNALEGKKLPVYGQGTNVRDWLHVDDHAEGLWQALSRGSVGATYLFGGEAERTNLQVVEAICAVLDRLVPVSTPRRALITLVTDRPGHDQRYAMDIAATRAELGWAPGVDFETGLEATIRWYLENEGWWRPVREGHYAGERLGLGAGAR